MHAIRALPAVAAAAAVTVLALPGAADAATITQQFAADSGDACHYGTTSGTLGWNYGTATTSPVPVSSVTIMGQVTDHPLPTDPTAACPDDGYASTATFTEYTGTTLVGRQTEKADNSTAYFDLTVNSPSTGGIDRIVVQVCRSPVLTLPPTYCGKAVTYLAPPTA